jgi:signal transduction histidine kinase
VLFVLVAGVAIAISVLSYEYSLSTSQRIEDISIGYIRSNAEIQAHDLANSMSNKLADSVNTIELLAGAPAILRNDWESATVLLDGAQKSSAELVDFYMWLDSNGRMRWVSNINQTALEQYANIDLSYRLYFSVPRENHQLYYSSVVESNDQVNRLYMSYPILVNADEDSSTPDEFRGIIVAGIRTDTLGRFLQDQVSSNLQSEVALLDNRGIILYNEQSEYIGKNAFGVRFQAHLASVDVEFLRAINDGLDDALAGSSGLRDVPIDNGKISTFAYKPIILAEKQFGVLYILAPHTYAADVGPVIEQQRNLSIALIVIVTGAASGAILIIFTWNKRLESTVNSRTVELRAANEQLMSHDRLQREFINIAAHELRTPVQPLLGVAEMLEHQFEKDNKKEITITKPEVDMLLRNARRLLNLSSGILEVSRIESNSLKLVKEPVDLKAKIETVVHDMQSYLPAERNVKLRVENKTGLTHEPIVVNADRERIFEVVSNLLSNAIKFTPEGEVVVAMEKTDDNSVVVSIKDSGKGIDQEILPRLFTKFATNSETGTGLGLYIAKSIIEAHGGKIWAQNNEGERGATFSFSLPLIQSAKLE